MIPDGNEVTWGAGYIWAKEKRNCGAAHHKKYYLVILY